MANSLLTTAQITYECLDVLENNLGFAGLVNRQYDSQFAETGGKIGATINVRKPPRYQVGTGPVIDPQATIDTYTPLTLTDQLNVSMAFSSADLALNVDDFKERIINPAMAALANQIDFLGAQRMYRAVGNLVGTAGQLTNQGTPPTSQQAITAILAAGQKLDECATPMDIRNFVINPATNTGLVQAQSSIYQEITGYKGQYEKGAVSAGILGFNMVRDQNVVNHTYGSFTTGTVNGAQAATNIAQSATDAPFALTVNALGGNITAGTSITIAGVFNVNPQSRQSTGALQNFVVTADAAASATTLNIWPYPVFSGPFQNCYSSSASIPNSAAIALIGSPTASTAYPMNIAFHKNAFTLATADLPLPSGNGEAKRASSKSSGLSIRLVQGWYDARTDQFVSRIDCLMGWKALYPELACKLQG